MRAVSGSCYQFASLKKGGRGGGWSDVVGWIDSGFGGYCFLCL